MKLGSNCTKDLLYCTEKWPPGQYNETLAYGYLHHQLISQLFSLFILKDKKPRRLNVIRC